METEIFVENKISKTQLKRQLKRLQKSGVTIFEEFKTRADEIF